MTAHGDDGRVSAAIREQLIGCGLDPEQVTDLISRAVSEDLDGGVDVTTVATVPPGQRATLDLVARANGTVAGVPVAAAVFSFVCGSAATVRMVATDGDAVRRGDVVLSVTGPTHGLLQAERPALNLLGHLSGIATATHEWVIAVSGTSAAIRDTRKTTPGMRRLEKYAVRCGGGVNHRMSLSDAALVKDNHVVAAGGVAAAFDAVRAQFPGVPVEVEVDSLDQFDEVLAAGADLVLLDNFTLDQMAEAVRRNAGRALLEASGGLTIDTAAAVAATGVDYLAIGALTHSAPVLDIGADLRQES
jgi:nicotinate-nucleotide pyrophosphorylase (carboxylating)